DDRADIAAADEAERLAGHLDAHETVLFPFAGLGRGVGLGQLAGEGEHQGDGVLGSGDRIAERRVHHHHAARRGCRDVDIVDSDPGAPDDLQVAGCVEQRLGYLGRGADREAIILADDRLQFVRRLAGDLVDLDSAVAEDRRRLGIHLVGNEDADSHCNCSQAQSSHGPRASISDVPTVAPHQIRRPGGASRYPAMSKAAPSFSSSLAKRLMKSLSAPSTVRQTLVRERMAGSWARWPSQLRAATIVSSATALPSVRLIMPLRPPTEAAHSSVT